VGEVHEIIFDPSAARGETSADYLFGDSILLHLRTSFDRKLLKINDFVQKWRQELGVELDDNELLSKINVRITVLSEGFEIVVGDRSPILFERQTPILEVDHVRIGGGILWNKIEASPPVESEAELLPENKSTASLPLSGHEVVVQANLLWATLLCRKELPNEAVVQIFVDHRLAGESEVGACERDGERLRIRYKEDTLVLDGMLLEAHLKDGKNMRVLGQCYVKARYVGGLDRVSETLVRGWAADLDVSGSSLSVDIFLDGAFVSTARCDRPRNDLKRLDPTIVNSGFLFKFPTPVFLPESRDVRLDVFVHDTHYALDHSPWWICRKVALKVLNPQEAASSAAAAA
jgi:hypothetical protein